MGKSNAILAVFAMLVPFGIFAFKRVSQTLCIGLLLVMMGSTLTGCDTLYSLLPKTPAVTYTVSIRATDADHNMRSVTLTRTVTR